LLEQDGRFIDGPFCSVDRSIRTPDRPLWKHPEIDILSLSALTAANFGATAEIARMLGEEEFTLLFHKGRSENVYFSAIGEHVIMVTLFDDKTSLGLIRLQINKIIDELSIILSSIFEKGRMKPGESLQSS